MNGCNVAPIDDAEVRELHAYQREVDVKDADSSGSRDIPDYRS